MQMQTLTNYMLDISSYFTPPSFFANLDNLVIQREVCPSAQLPLKASTRRPKCKVLVHHQSFRLASPKRVSR